jgi:hypothetical protein
VEAETPNLILISPLLMESVGSAIEDAAQTYIDPITLMSLHQVKQKENKIFAQSL